MLIHGVIWHSCSLDQGVSLSTLDWCVHVCYLLCSQWECNCKCDQSVHAKGAYHGAHILWTNGLYCGVTHCMLCVLLVSLHCVEVAVSCTVPIQDVRDALSSGHTANEYVPNVIVVHVLLFGPIIMHTCSTFTLIIIIKVILLISVQFSLVPNIMAVQMVIYRVNCPLKVIWTSCDKSVVLLIIVTCATMFVLGFMSHDLVHIWAISLITLFISTHFALTFTCNSLIMGVFGVLCSLRAGVFPKLSLVHICLCPHCVFCTCS